MSLQELTIENEGDHRYQSNFRRLWYNFYYRNKRILAIIGLTALAVQVIALIIAVVVLASRSNSSEQITITTSETQTISSSSTIPPATTLPFNASNENVITWAGYQWNVYNELNGIPGNNSFTSDNVWVDSDNNLHLKLSYDPINNQWWCAQLSTQTIFSFGVFVFYINGQVDQLDPNVVFTIYTYNNITQQPEIVIEFSTFGSQDIRAQNLWYRVFPDNVDMDNLLVWEYITLNNNYSTYWINWQTDSLILQGQNGFSQTPSDQTFPQLIVDTSRLLSVPQNPSPVYITLWINGDAPINGQEVEIIVENFNYTSY